MSTLATSQVTVTIIDGDGRTISGAHLRDGLSPEHHITEAIEDFRRALGGHLVAPLTIHYSEQA